MSWYEIGSGNHDDAAAHIAEELRADNERLRAALLYVDRFFKECGMYEEYHPSLEQRVKAALGKFVEVR